MTWINDERIKQHAIDSEVAPLHVLARIVGEADFVGMTPIGVADIGTKRRDLNRACGATRSLARQTRLRRLNRYEHDSELLADGKRPRKDLHDLLRSRVSRNVIVSRLAAEQQVTNASTGKVSLIPALAQRAHDVGSVLLGSTQGVRINRLHWKKQARGSLLEVRSSQLNYA